MSSPEQLKRSLKVSHQSYLDDSPVLERIEDVLYIAFPGTKTIEDFLHVTNNQLTRSAIDPSFQVHAGFQERFLQSREMIMDYPIGRYPTVIVTGHSMGGSIANYCALDVSRALESQGVYSTVYCVTFGAPKPGGQAFQQAFESSRVLGRRFVYGNDPAVHYPIGRGYQHASKPMRLGCPHRNPLKDHMLQSYQQGLRVRFL